MHQVFLAVAFCHTHYQYSPDHCYIFNQFTSASAPSTLLDQLQPLHRSIIPIIPIIRPNYTCIIPYYTGNFQACSAGIIPIIRTQILFRPSTKYFDANLTCLTDRFYRESFLTLTPIPTLFYLFHVYDWSVPNRMSYLSNPCLRPYLFLFLILLWYHFDDHFISHFFCSLLLIAPEHSFGLFSCSLCATISSFWYFYLLATWDIIIPTQQDTAQKWRFWAAKNLNKISDSLRFSVSFVSEYPSKIL